MDSPFGRYLTSPLFTFQVGPDKHEVMIHSYLLSKLSHSLDRLLNGGMRESKDRTVDWSDVDMDTFIRLCEFAQMGDYTPPRRTFKRCFSSPEPGLSPENSELQRKEETTEDPNAIVSQSPILEFSEKEAGSSNERHPAATAELRDKAHQTSPPGSHLSFSEIKLPHKKKSFFDRDLRDSFRKNPPTLPIKIISEIAHRAPQKRNPWDDFAPVFFGQGRLYALADKYGVESLCQLIIYRLHETLRTFLLFTRDVIEIIEFVRFVYANTPPRYGRQKEPLRDLITRYVVSVVGQIGEEEAFRDLLEEGGEFVTDFWDTLWELDDKPSSRSPSQERPVNTNGE